MNQADIDAELKQVVRPLLVNGGDVHCYYSIPVRSVGDRYVTNGKVPLEFVVTSKDNDYYVFVTKIGKSQAINNLPEQSFDTLCVLPEKVFVPDDPFQEIFFSYLPASAYQYGIYNDMCHRFKPESVFEIGVRGGYSAWAMLSAGTVKEYVGWDGDNGLHGGVIGYMDYARSMLKREFANVAIEIAKVNSQLMFSLPRQFDLISIDGAHGHNEVIHDLELCVPFGRYLIIDDTTSLSTVHSGVCEFLESHPELNAWRYDTWRGTVVIDTGVHND